MDFIFDPSLVLYLPLYQLDGSSCTSKDARGHLCTVSGATLYPGRGRYFDGTDDFIDLGDDRFDSLTEGTILVWVKPEASGTSEHFIGWAVDANNRAYLTRRSDDRLAAAFKSGGVWRMNSVGNTSFVVGNWYLVGYISGNDGNQLVMNGNKEEAGYVDGDASTQFFFGNLASGTTTYSLGRGMISGANWSYGNVSIGALAVYSRVLTPQEIQHIYLQTKWRYQ